MKDGLAVLSLSSDFLVCVGGAVQLQSGHESLQGTRFVFSYQMQNQDGYGPMADVAVWENGSPN